ncbi:MAG: DUF1573 domain-containing protein [Ignavibacteriales bacterium]|nr:DUF1573 domain-containing protein [Ignavibacteriales bacterium]
MKRILLLTSTAFFIFSSILFSQPKFQLVGPERFDIGDVPNFIPHNHALTIKNLGNDTLILKDLSASCGCTATLLSVDHIPPGDSGKLSFVFDAKRFDGKVEKKISVNTNDPIKKHVEIFFTANVIRVLDIQPEYFFIRTTNDSTVTQTLKVENLSQVPIEFTSIQPSGKDISITLNPKEIKPGEKGDLTATYIPKTIGSVSGNIEIKTNHPQAPLLTIRYFCWSKDKK